MKKITGVFTIVFIVFIHCELFAQSVNQDCKVLKETISGSYEGECRKGLAHGKGKAIGKDSYEGEFKKGLPNGQGTYKYSNGAVYSGEWSNGLKNGKGEYKYKVNYADSVLTGYWKDDKYIGKYSDGKGYIINRNQFIPRYTFVRTGDGSNLEFIIIQSGSKIIPDALDLNPSSGYLEIMGNTFFIKNVGFPYKGKISYQIFDQLSSKNIDCELEFEILKPGNWQITFKH